MSWSFPKFVHVREDGPRDGFQNEQTFIPTATKIALINELIDAGLRRVEVTSFVHPKWIPQLADAEQVLRQIDQRSDASFTVLAPNRHGLRRAIECRSQGVKIDELAFFMSASDSHNRANVNKSSDESMIELKELVLEAKVAGFRVGGSVSTAFGCPFEGRVPPERVLEFAKEMQRAGVDEITFGDTIGCATPNAVRDMFARAKRELSGIELSAHFHNTRGAGLANVIAAMLEGVASFDTAFGELGGCPYAPGATGNIATEDLVCMLHEMGIETGIDLERLVHCARHAQQVVGRQLPGHVLHAGPMNWHGSNRLCPS